jgi:hypothetical protein
MGSEVAVQGVEARLVEWAAWFNAGGCSDGAWPKKNILHPSWMPPCGGWSATVVSGARPSARERQVHAAIGLLTDKLIVCIVLRYAKRMTAPQQAATLGCTEQAIDTRLKRARDLVWDELQGQVCSGALVAKT